MLGGRSIPPPAGGIAMTDHEIKDEWITPGPNGEPPDISREEAAFERERARLARDHLGKFVLLRFDEVVGVFNSPGEAIKEGYRRFGMKRMVLREITEYDEPEFITHVDVNHPSFKRLD
jgi:hypothetical protein